MMFVRKQHTQEPKEPKDCDWNHFSLTDAVPIKLASKHGRGLELIQLHFAARSSNSIEAHRMRKRYKELTDKDDDFLFFSFKPRPRRCCWDEQIAIPETRVFRKR